MFIEFNNAVINVNKVDYLIKKTFCDNQAFVIAVETDNLKTYELFTHEETRDKRFEELQNLLSVTKRITDPLLDDEREKFVAKLQENHIEVNEERLANICKLNDALKNIRDAASNL